MKNSDFEKILKELGFYLDRVGGHKIWTNGQRHVSVPNKRDINRMLAKRLLKEIGYQQNVPQINYFYK